MKKILRKSSLILTSLLVLNTTACSLFDYDLSEAFYRRMKVEERATNLTELNNETNLQDITEDDEYDVLIITDVHFGNENKKDNGPRREDEWFEHLKKVNPDTGKAIIDNVKFVISLGDVVEHGYEKEYQRFKTDVVDVFANIKTTKAPEGIKLYNVVGNHDLYNTGWLKWSDTLYPGTSFYKFETPSFSWYFLDSASGTLGGEQFDSLKYNMQKDKKTKLVFTHVPIYAENLQYFIMQNSEERNKLISTLSRNKTQYIIDGHTHIEHYSDFGTFAEKNLPSFLSKSKYGILHVNEKTKTTSIDVVQF